MTDPIADMLTRIRNALNVNKAEVTVPYSSLKERIAALLVESGYIDGFGLDETGHKQIVLKLSQPGRPHKISHVERISRPGRRMYAKTDEIPTVLNGRGTVLVSTSKGVMTGKQAREQRLGGELLCEVY